MSNQARIKYIAIVVLLGGVLAVSLWFRVWRVDHIPGINGDEAWYGVQAVRIVRSESPNWTTPSGLPLNPFFMGPMVLLHAFYAPSFPLLRLPAIISGALTLVAPARGHATPTFDLHRLHAALRPGGRPELRQRLRPGQALYAIAPPAP